MNESFTVCPGCGQSVDPNDPTLAYGYEQKSLPVFGNPNEVIDGIGAYFHQGHFPHGSPDWRRAEKPEKA